MYEFPLLRRIQKRAGFLAIPNLMMILTGAMAIVYLFESFFRAQYGVSLYSILYFDRAAIFAGQIWRIFTFLFIPASSGLLWTILSLMLYLYFGRSLENAWGSFGFTVYYLLGAAGAILSGLLTGYATNTYLNLSLFFAFAAMFPNEEVYLFGILPIKMKYLALVDLLIYAQQFLTGSASTRVNIVLCLLNVILFLGGDLLQTIRRESQYWKTRYNFRKTMRR
jgi:membrane associated rhomboid family serine protease